MGKGLGQALALLECIQEVYPLMKVSGSTVRLNLKKYRSNRKQVPQAAERHLGEGHSEGPNPNYAGEEECFQ